MDSFRGKTVSILSHSASTYDGVSNNTADNSTIGKNDVYYTEGRHGVYREDTWWQQVIDVLDMRLLVNNSWSGSCVLQPRKGEASVAYKDRAVNLHNDHTGEEPDIIWVYIGGNDFAYYKDTYGKAADVDYDALIKANGDGSYTYAEPTTTCEAYAITLHKAATRYPEAEIYCITSTARREVDYTGDSYPDAGQPTEYSAQLWEVAAHFGYPVVDLEKAIPKDVEIFDSLMGDKRAHPNAEGMDRISEELLSVMLGREVTLQEVTGEYDGVTTDHPAAAAITGEAYKATLTPEPGYSNLSVTVTMGGEDITQTAYADGKITVSKVTGDLVITAKADRTPLHFRWEMEGSSLRSLGDENALTALAGTVTDGVITGGRYQAAIPMVLKHDRPWVLEWKCGGDWRGAILTSAPITATVGKYYLSRTKGGQLCFGAWSGSQYDNYGVDLSALDAGTHTFRLENRIAADGSNMIYLSLDGGEALPMNNYFVGSKAQNTTSNWVSGKDFSFGYLGTDSAPLNDCKLEYLLVCEDTSLSLSYDDRYDVSGKEVEIIDSGKPTSYQVGYGVAEGTLDTAVVTLDGDKLIATGIGAAKVKIDGVTYTVTVKAAPISLLLLIGQSNAEGMVGVANQSIACENGQVYSTYAKANGLVGDAGLTVENARNYVPSALTGTYSTVNINGNNTKLGEYPVNSLTEAGNGKYGMDSGLAYEWVKQTGEKVWVINAAHGASSISSWQKGQSNFEEAVALFSACEEVLLKEIAAGHYTFSRMGYYWCQGCADETRTAEWYVERYTAMHDALKEALAFDATINESTDKVTFEFGNIILVMAGHENAVGYRHGTYEDSSEAFFATFKELEMRGPRVAQIWMANNPELEDIHIVSTIAQDWVTMPDGSDGVAEYFAAHYENGTIDYPTQTKQGDAWYKPTAPAEVKNSIHYYQKGYNEVGREAARNTMYILGLKEKPDVQTRVEFVDWTGYKSVTQIKSSNVANSETLVVPVVYPCYESKSVTYTLSEGTQYHYYDLTVSGFRGGTLSASVGGKTVSVAGKESYNSYRFELKDNELVSVSGAGFTENTLKQAVSTQQVYKLAENIILQHDKEWRVDFYAEDSTRFMALSTAASSVAGQFYIFKSQSGTGVLSVGEYKDGKYQNYGVLQSQVKIDWTKPHVYSFRNAVTEDGTNTIGIYIDDVWVSSTTTLIIDGAIQNQNNRYLSGKDFVFPYIGASGFALGNNQILWMEIHENTSLSLSYDDRYDVTGKEVEIIDAGVPTSYQVGYGVAEGTLDTAVITLNGNKLIATGIGTAKVKIDGVTYTVTVKAAPISLLLLIGQSNMRGSEGDPNQSIVCPDGMVYSTYGDDRGASNTAMTVNNATSFAPSALTGPGSLLNVNGNTDCLGGYPLNSLTAEGAGRMGPDSGFAYEWVKQTGEKVWVVNAAHGGTSITTWQKGKANYEEALLLFGACQETLRKEIAAGHYTLSHMGYFWCQGCSDRTQTAKWYVEKYLAMHENLKKDLAFDEDTTFEFGGIIPVRVGSTAACYRDGVQTATNSYAYHESFVDLRMNGPRVAQYWMINNPALSDIWGVCNIGDDWVWMPDGTNGVEAYFNAHYENGRVDYTTQVAQKESWYTPTTPKAVHDSIHYNQIGYNEIGRESVRNALILLGVLEAPETEPTVEFVSWDGFTPVESIDANTTPGSETLVVPLVSPIWRSKEVTYSLSDSLTWEYYDLLAVSDTQSGTLSSPYTNQTVTVSGHAWSAWETVFKPTPEGAGQEKRVCTDCGIVQTRVLKGVWQLYDLASHMQTMPEEYCKDTNLWAVLEHDPYYFASGTRWSIYSSGEVPSVTIPVEPGDKIFATSFGKAVENGHATSNGIRVTFFGEYGVVKTMDPAGTYKEFSANGGYLIAPEGAIAINVAMWNGSDDNELYVLNRDHVYENGACAGCGCTPSLLEGHLQQLPENLCKKTNLWTALTPENIYYTVDGWGLFSNAPDVHSVTFPVKEGERVWASSFGNLPENGNGTRITWFDENGVLETVARDVVYAEFTKNGYITVPAGAITLNVPMPSADQKYAIYLLDRDHVYQNGTCAGCGKQEPKPESFDGKVISILSASTSTFEGYTPVADGFNLDHRDRYPQDNLLTHVNDTWWMQTIQELNAKLGINDSWAGSQVLNTQDTNSGDLGPDAAMASITRIKNLGSNGTPDVILFFGGGNDMGRGVALGSFDPATAPTEVDLTATKWESFADAYVAAIMRLQYFYPEAKILAMTSYPMPSYVTQAKLDKYGPVVQAICDHYGVEYLSLQDCGVTFEMLPDDIHPNAEGMDYITAAVVEKLTDTFVLPAGETVVHTVTHSLSQAKASLGYYKGISAGKSFEETLTGEDLAVTVTMGGVDITATAYKNGVISIPAVTGDLVITAKGKFTADGHLQQLPEVYCPATNLWQALTPEKIYYTASGWGNTSAGDSWSITFPVKEGDRIWATSFGAYPDNGSTANGVRITWFGENGVLQTLSRDVVYAEFAKNGYVTAPAGAVALNVPMTGNQAHYAVYILSAEHSYSNGICTACGEKEPLIPVGWSPVPLSTEKNSDHLAYKLENGVLIFHDFGNSSMEDYGRLPDYTNSDDQLSRYSITEWYQSRADIHAVRFDETISYVGQYTLTNMDKISEIRIDNPTATVAVHAVLFSTTDRKEPLEIYAASTLNTTESWIRGNGYRKISAAVSKVTMFYTDLAHLAPALSELESALQNAEAASPSLLYEALALVKDVPQNTYNLSDYTPAIPGAESTLAFLWDLTSGFCGESVTYRITAGEEKGTFKLSLQGDGSMTAYAKQSDVPWNVVMDAITDVTIEDGVNGFCDLALPGTATYRMHLNSPAYAYAAEKGLTIRLETLRILCIGNSHTVDYSEFLPSILKDLQNAGLETDFVISKATIGSIGLYSGRNSNINATHRSHLEALQNSAGAYKSLKNNRYDLIIIQDYMESVVDDPQTFAAGLATFIQAVRTVSEGQGTPEIAWFTDWVDIRSTGGDSALYDGNGNKIYLEVLSREQVYEKSLANIAYVEKAIAAGTPNMPDFVIHASTIKQNAMSSYLGASKLYDKNAYCLLERDTTHLTYELGRYLMGAGVLSELINHYSHVLDIDGGSLNVGNALTVENGPAATGTGSQYTGAVNEEILSIIREAISSPLQFKPSVYTQDPVDKFLQSVEEMEWNPTGEPEKEAALQLLKDRIQASFGSMVESYTVEMVSYASPYDFTFSIHVTHGYTIRKESFTIHICHYTATVTPPTCTEKGYTTYTCECGDSYVAEEVAATGHSYKATVTKPTCTAEGYTTYTCHCGDSYVADKVPATGHSFSNWETTKEATCTANGEQRRDCKNCDHYETKVIAATGHSYTSVVTKPTCTTEGYTTYTCHCGDSYVADKTPATGHTFGEWTTTEEATCTANGEQRRDCKNCDHFETRAIPATGHSYKATVTKPSCTAEGYTTYTCHCGDSYVADKVSATGHSFGAWETVKEATCTANGEQRRECKNCDHFETKVIAATGHSYKATVTKPTCTAEGYTTYTCHCGDSYVADIVPATGHSFGEWTTTKEATCTADGEQRRDCKNCDHYETKIIPATGHGYKATVTKPTCTTEGYTTYTCHCGDTYVADKTPATGHTFGEWTTTKEATCTANGEQRRDCANCDHYETKVIAATGHSYKTTVTAPTCTAEGFTTYTCHCGDSYVADKVPATGHSFGEWTTIKEATCTANGEQRRDCKNCDHFETKAIPATGHSYKATITKPTCTTEGYTTYTCHCGDSYVANKTPATGHSFGEWATTKEATCTVNGEQRRDCANCDHFETKTIAATGHSYTSVVTKPTCTAEGYTTYTCHCGDSYVADKVPAKGHTFGEWTTTKEATCTANGEQRRDCKNCDHFETKDIPATGHSYQAKVTKPTCTTEGYTTYTCHCGDSYVADKVPATGHSFGEWATTKEATCTANGEQRRDCKNCDHFETKVMSATGHSYKATVTKSTCTAEGYTTYACHCGDSYVADKTPATGHSFGNWETVKEATCTANGEQRRDCANCDHFETKVMSATGHSYKATVTKPTCTAEGYTTYTCHCGDSYVADKVPALGHTWDGGVVTKEPTEEAEGTKLYTCTACGETKTEVIPALDHVHRYETTVTQPTCTTEGYTTYTCRCGDTYVADKVPALGHNYQATITKPTCTTEGFTTYTCHCGDSYVADKVPALGHDYQATVTKPTCTTEGFTTYTCHCGNSYVADKTPATGHTWDGGVVTKESTEETEGTKLYTCTACGETRTEVIPTLDHVHRYEVAVTKPTCTTEGYTTYTCRCGDSYVADKVPALGHDYQATVTKPTCTEGGYTTYTCHCGDSYVADKAPATGHTWDGGVVAKEPTEEAEGSKLYTCTVCGETKTEVIPTLDHVHRYEATITKPTCTTEGYTTYTCACGDSYVADKVPATGHSFGEWQTVTEATCIDGGTERRDCKNCDHYETKDIPATGHSYQATITKPTCTEDGYTTYTCHCGDTYVADKVPATGHDYDSVVTNPTCTEKGYVTYTCHCGDNYVGNYTPATGHAWDGGVVTQEPTEDTTGTKVFTCTTCGEIKEEILPKLEHVHRYTAVVTDPTCTEQGYTTYTCHCGDSYVADKTPATGHTYGEWTTAKEATCTVNGEQRRECANCDHYETKVIAATGHKHEGVVTEPTCTEKGFTTYKCHCGDTYVDNYVDPTGHAWTEWHDTTPGKEERSCTACGKTESRDKTPAYDVDGNGVVDQADVELLMSILVGNTETETLYDFDFDGVLTIYDCVLLMQQLS